MDEGNWRTNFTRDWFHDNEDVEQNICSEHANEI